ncbi:unnamed protein product [Ectocarpus sp. 6 AP-2014]
MVITTRCSGLAILVLLSLLGDGEALFGRGKGGGGAATAAKKTSRGTKGSPARTKLDPDMMETAAMQASERLLMWGTTTIFQLKEAARMKGHVERLQASSQQVDQNGRAMVKMDPPMYKAVVGSSLGNVFLMLNSPNFGKLSEKAKSMLKDEGRQMRLIDMDQRTKESFAAQKGQPTGVKGPEGYLEGALLNKEVAAAHEKFLADVEALSSSAVGKKAAASAEAYHQAMLAYTTSEDYRSSLKSSRSMKK